MKILKFFEKKPFIIALFIFLLAFSFRFIAALKLAWRPDEIMYVDWVGKWFSEHFVSYFFQFFHQSYPSRSPYFGNPPLAMWMMTLGIWLAQKFHFSALLGARLINVFIGSLTAVYLFYLGKKWFGLGVGLLASLSFALMAMIIVNNATAYLDTLSALLILVGLNLFFRYVQEKKSLHLYLLGLVLGLLLLTKFVNLPLILVFWLGVYWLSKKEKKFKKQFMVLIIITLLTPVLLWSGLRDPEHYLGVYYVYKNQLFRPYPVEYPIPLFGYYYLMLLGLLPPLIFLGGLFGVLITTRRVIQEGWQKYWPLVSILVLIFAFITYNSVFTGYTSSHQLLAILPLVLILAAVGLVRILKFLSRTWLKIAIIAIILIGLLIPLLSFRPQFWGIYSSLLVGGSNYAFRLYSAGASGEEVPEVASYLMENTPKDSRIAVMADDWLFPKYTQERSFTAISLDEGIVGAYGRGAEYVVLPRMFLEISSRTIEELARFEPIYASYEKGILLAKVYQVDYSKIKEKQKFSLGSKEDWQIKYLNNNPDWQINNNELEINYAFEKEYSLSDNQYSQILLKSQQVLDNLDQGLSLEIFGDGQSKLLTLMLIGQDGSILTYETKLDWRGWKRIYISPKIMRYSSKDSTRSIPNFQQNYHFYLGFLSKKAIQGKVIFRDIAIATLENQ